MRYILSLILSLFVITPAMAYPTLETTATQGIVMEAETNQVLWAKEPRTQMPTSSMSKVMTAIIVYDALKTGDIKHDTTFPVSEKAWRMGGSKMFVDLNSEVSVEDLLHGVVIQSGNDACIVLAEGIAGTEEAFVERMNQKAQQLGLKNTHFMNATGWPDPNHYSTPEDLALLAKYLIDTYPEEYKNHAIPEWTYNTIKQGNRNPLLGRVRGGDGVKTGHTEVAGYGLIGSAERDGRRIIMVMNGWPTIMSRYNEAPGIIEWAFRNFKTTEVGPANTALTEIAVAYGKARSVKVGMTKSVKITQPVGAAGAKTRYVIKGKSPLVAPVKQGEHIADLTVYDGDKPMAVYPLVALEEVKKGSVVDTIRTNVMFLLRGK